MTIIPQPFLKTKNGSILDGTKKMLYCSLDRFISDISTDKCCFICGANKDDTKFNKEHILPRWLLKKFELFDQKITLPNDNLCTYGTYTVKCCEDCNSLMGETIENPLRSVINQGPLSLIEYIKTEKGARLIYNWLALIFFKTHLKDNSLQQHKDQRKGTNRIGEWHDWNAFHHIHALARSFYTQARWNDIVYGSVFCFQVQGEEGFDFSDLGYAQTLYLKLGDIGLFVVFNDGGACSHAIKDIWEIIDAPLSALQAREFTAHLACASAHLKNPPYYGTKLEPTKTGDFELLINAEHDKEPEFLEREHKFFGQILWGQIGSLMGEPKTPEEERIKKDILQGKWSCLFNEKREFIKHNDT